MTGSYILIIEKHSLLRFLTSACCPSCAPLRACMVASAWSLGGRGVAGVIAGGLGGCEIEKHLMLSLLSEPTPPLDPLRNVVIGAQWWRGSWWGGQAGGVCEGVVLVRMEVITLSAFRSIPSIHHQISHPPKPPAIAPPTPRPPNDHA